MVNPKVFHSLAVAVGAAVGAGAHYVYQNGFTLGGSDTSDASVQTANPEYEDGNDLRFAQPRPESEGAEEKPAINLADSTLPAEPKSISL